MNCWSWRLIQPIFETRDRVTALSLKGQCRVFILALPGHSCDQILTSKNIPAQNASYFEIGTYPKSPNTLLHLTSERENFFIRSWKFSFFFKQSVPAYESPTCHAKVPPPFATIMMVFNRKHLSSSLRCRCFLPSTWLTITYSCEYLLVLVFQSSRYETAR